MPSAHLSRVGGSGNRTPDLLQRRPGRTPPHHQPFTPLSGLALVERMGVSPAPSSVTGLDSKFIHGKTACQSTSGKPGAHSASLNTPRCMPGPWQPTLMQTAQGWMGALKRAPRLPSRHGLKYSPRAPQPCTCTHSKIQDCGSLQMWILTALLRLPPCHFEKFR